MQGLWALNLKFAFFRAQSDYVTMFNLQVKHEGLIRTWMIKTFKIC